MAYEHRAPERIEPQSLADYLEVMSKAVFQIGMSWKVVDNKWPGIRQAFHDFDPAAVDALTPDDLDALTSDPRVIRNRRKIEAIVDNAHQILELDRQHGTSSAGSGQGFRAYLRSHDGFEATVKDLRRRFKFLGDLGSYYFLWVVNEEVPSYEDWCASRGRTPTH